MEQFKLKSIDEFDLEFSQSNKSSENTTQKESLIPEINTAQSDITADNNTGLQTEEPATSIPGVYVSLAGENKSQGLFDAIDEEDGEPEKEKNSSTGLLIGKIASIVLLAITVIIFVAGCFISVFLDNNGAAIAGTTFNSMSIDNDRLGISKGDMIIGKKLDASEYTQNTYIAVPSSTGEGCDVMSVTSVYFDGTSAQLTCADTTGNTAYYSQPVYSSDEIYGEVSSFIPSVAGVLSFAMENAILVCVLFVLLAAMWCLLLVLIEKSSSKKNKEVESVEDGNSEIEEIILDE